MELSADFAPDLMAHTWDQKIAQDLIAEVSRLTGTSAASIEEVRRLLAVKGYRELLKHIRRSKTATGPEGLKQIARAMRTFAKERPGLAAATFRNGMTDWEEWRAAATEIRDYVYGVFAECDIDEGHAEQALRMLRSLVRGFVMHEMMDSFVDPQGYGFAVDVFIVGLRGLRSHQDQPTQDQPTEAFVAA